LKIDENGGGRNKERQGDAVELVAARFSLFTWNIKTKWPRSFVPLPCLMYPNNE
jgi:hypothetical protein